MISPKDIFLYPMTMDMRGQRTHEEYVDSMAKMLVNTMIGYRLEYSEMIKLIQYAEQEHDRLNSP